MIQIKDISNDLFVHVYIYIIILSTIIFTNTITLTLHPLSTSPSPLSHTRFLPISLSLSLFHFLTLLSFLTLASPLSASLPYLPTRFILTQIIPKMFVHGWHKLDVESTEAHTSTSTQAHTHSSLITALRDLKDRLLLRSVHLASWQLAFKKFSCYWCSHSFSVVSERAQLLSVSFVSANIYISKAWGDFFTEKYKGNRDMRQNHIWFFCCWHLIRSSTIYGSSADKGLINESVQNITLTYNMYTVQLTGNTYIHCLFYIW